jgi:hypothetical protein
MSKATKRREHLAAGALLALAMLMLFSQLTLHPRDLLVGVQRDGRNDVTSHTLAARSVMRNAYDQHGEVAYWHGDGLLGSPWLGNPQSALFYPPHWLFFFANVAACISWMTVGHHWFAGLGVYFLCRRQQVSWSGAMVAGVCFAGAPFLIAQTAEGHSTQVFLISWAPWAFLVYDHLRTGLRNAWALMALVLATAFFCGHVQEVYYLVLILSCLILTDMMLRSAGSSPPLVLAKHWFMAGVATVGLVAIELGPNWVYTKFGVRAQGLDAQAAGRISVNTRNFIQLLDPFSLGDATNYQGPGQYFWETLCCFGVAPLALAVIGVILARNRWAATRWAVIAALSLLFAMGGDTPLFPAMHRFVPGVALFRSPSRALFFTSLAIAMLSGVGWDSVRSRLASISALRPVARWSTIAALFVCSCELSYYANAMLATVPPSGLRSDSPVAASLLKERNVGRVLVQQELLSDREAWAVGIEKLRRYEPVPLARAFAIMASLAPTRNIAQEVTGFGPLDLTAYQKPLLDMLGVTHVVLASQQPGEIPGWEVVARGVLTEEVVLRGRQPRTAAYVIYRNPSAFPRAFVLGRSKLIGSQSTAAVMATLEPKQEVLLSEDVLPPGPRQSFAPADVTRRTPNRVVVDATLSEPGYLVLSDTYYPGWRATVDGAPHDIAPANLGLRSIPLGAGEHHVVLQYSPPGFAIGAVVSLLSAAVVAYSCIGSLRGALGPRVSATPSPRESERTAQ